MTFILLPVSITPTIMYSYETMHSILVGTAHEKLGHPTQ